MAFQDTYNQKSLLEQQTVTEADSFQKKLIEAIRGEDQYRKGTVRTMPLSELPFFGVGSWASTLSTGASSLFRIADVNYYLELYFDNQLITTIGFPFDPSAIAIERNESTTLTHTLGGIIRETGENKIGTITIVGQSGYAERLGYTRSGSYCFENGEVILHEFDEFLKSYNYLCSIFSNSAVNGSLIGRYKNSFKAPFTYLENRQMLRAGNENNTTGINNNSKNLFLVLRCVNEDLALKVEIENFIYKKATATNRFGYIYELRLKSYGNYGLATRDNFITAALKLAAAKVRMIAGLLAVAKNVLLNLRADYITPILALFNTLDTLCREFDGMITAGKGLGEGVIAVANEIYSLVKKIVNVAGLILNPDNGSLLLLGGAVAISAFMPGGDDTNKNAEAAKGAYENLGINEALQLDRAQRGLINSQTDIINLTEDLQNYIYANNNNLKKQIDNLEIVQRMLTGFDYDVSEDEQNSLSSLKSILNQLYYANEGLRTLIPKDFDVSKLKSSSYKNVSSRFDIDEQDINFSNYILKENENLKTVCLKFFGDLTNLNRIIFLNGWLDANRKNDGSWAAAGDTVKIPGGDGNLYNKSSYETDIRMPFDDITFTEDDISLVYGLNNIEQQIKNLFLTEENGLQMNLGWGLGSLIGVQNLPFLKTKIKQQILADTRFKSIQFKDISTIDDKLFINIDIKLVTGDTVNISTTLSV